MKVIEEIQFLERKGISITIGNETKRIYFVKTLILGDNLGLHTVLSFVERFSANFFCRFCLIERKNVHTVFNERNCVLHNAKNYETLAAKKMYGADDNINKPFSISVQHIKKG